MATESSETSEIEGEIDSLNMIDEEALLKDDENTKNKTEFTPIHCDVCDKTVNSSAQAAAHYSGKGHQYRMRTFNNPTMSPTKPVTKPAAPVTAVSLKCKLCKRNFNSHSQLQAHITGKAHQFASQNGAAINYSTITEPSPLPSPPLPSSSVSVGSNMTKFFHCAMCNITLNSHKQMEQHNKGLRHKIVTGKAKPPQNAGTGEKWENVRYMKIANAVLGINKDNITGSGGGMNLREFYCEKCDITMNSQVQLDQHLESQKHKLKGTEAGNNMPQKRKRENMSASNPIFQPACNGSNYQPYNDFSTPFQPRPNKTAKFLPPLHASFVPAPNLYGAGEHGNIMNPYPPEAFLPPWNQNYIF